MHARHSAFGGVLLAEDHLLRQLNGCVARILTRFEGHGPLVGASLHPLFRHNSVLLAHVVVLEGAQRIGCLRTVAVLHHWLA